MNRFYTYIPILLLTAFASCQKEEAAPTPAVAKVTPAEGTPGTLLTIEGAGLGGLQKVLFGDANAPFNPVFNTEGALLIRVPAGAKYGPNTVTLMNSGGETTKTTLSFKVLQPAPTVDGFAPSEAGVGDTVTVTGKVFDNLVAVNFGAVKGRVLSSTKTSARVIVPDGVEKAPIEVVTAGGAGKSSLDFSPKGTGLYIFDEAIIGTWQSWSWAKVDFGNTERAKKGTKAIKLNMSSYGALWFNNPTPVEIGKFTTVKCWIYGGEGTTNKQLKVFYRDNDQAASDMGKGITLAIKPGVWTEYTLPIKDLGTATKIKGLIFQEFAGTDTTPVWIDELKLQ